MKAQTLRLLCAFSLLLVVTSLFVPFVNSAHAMGRTADAPPTPTRPTFACTYIVRPGDDLILIALRFNISYTAHGHKLRVPMLSF